MIMKWRRILNFTSVIAPFETYLCIHLVLCQPCHRQDNECYCFVCRPSSMAGCEVTPDK